MLYLYQAKTRPVEFNVSPNGQVACDTARGRLASLPLVDVRTLIEGVEEDGNDVVNVEMPATAVDDATLVAILIDEFRSLIDAPA